MSLAAFLIDNDRLFIYNSGKIKEGFVQIAIAIVGGLAIVCLVALPTIPRKTEMMDVYLVIASALLFIALYVLALLK